MPSEGDDDGLAVDREHRGSRVLWPFLAIGRRSALPPLGYGRCVDAVAGRHCSQARLTILYPSTDCCCRHGAPVVNLAHSASLTDVRKLNHQTLGSNI